MGGELPRIPNSDCVGGKTDAGNQVCGLHLASSETGTGISSWRSAPCARPGIQISFP